MESVEELERIERIQEILGYTFKNKQAILSAITHPSAAEGKPIQYSYERLEFLGDSVLGVIVAMAAFEKFKDLDEGGLTRIKVALVAGSTLSEVASELGFSDVIIFGDSEVGTGKRGMHSALENVYEAVVAALYIDGGFNVARDFISRTLLPRMTHDLAVRPENPKSALQEKLQTEGITPTYKLVETQGPPHDRTFVSAVFAGMQSLARGVGRTKKESESKAAAEALRELEERGDELNPREQKARLKAEKKAAKKAQKQQRVADRKARREGTAVQAGAAQNVAAQNGAAAGDAAGNAVNAAAGESQAAQVGAEETAAPVVAGAVANAPIAAAVMPKGVAATASAAEAPASNAATASESATAPTEAPVSAPASKNAD